MQIVIDIPERLWTKQLTADDYIEIVNAVANGTPLPEHHGDLIDRNELLDESYQIDSMYCEYDEVVNVDDIKDAPTIIERSDGNEYME